MAAPAVPGPGPYGPLRAPDANGIRLPMGFKSREIARTDKPVIDGGDPFHFLPDGMGTFKTEDGGFILVSNSEAPYAADFWEIGTAAIRFDKKFKMTDHYPILKGTDLNCSGGVTPWGTWLSCEERANEASMGGGKVWECDPSGVRPAVARPAMGFFKHEATSIDPIGKCAYLTEDLGDGCLYRFKPYKYPDLSRGRLDVASVQEDGSVKWIKVPNPQSSPTEVPPRKQVAEATQFRRGEGMWYDEGVIYFATTQDDRVYAYHCASEELEVLYDGEAIGEDAPLHDTDNVTVSPISGDLYVCEDAGDHQVCLISTEGQAAPFLQCPGEEHASSELTGPVFDPTGKRFYFASQRAIGGGVIYEISGPFRRTRAERAHDADNKKPSVRIQTLGKPTLRRLLKSGQPFRLTIGDKSPPVDLEITLVTRLRRAAGKGSRDVTIGRLSTKTRKPGVKRIRMKVGKRYRQRLRRRDVAQVKLIVVATDKEGNRRKTVKRVRFS